MTNTNIQLKERQKFFYVQQASELYDNTIELVCPQYSLIHQMLIQLIENHFNGDTNQSFTVLDVGAGTGMESIGILTKFPNSTIVALDFTPEILKVFKQKLTLEQSKRVVFVEKDFLSREVNDDFLKNQAQGKAHEGFDIVVSAYTIHNYLFNEKSIFYQKIFSSLKSKGVFINIDLFTHESRSLKEQAHNFDLNWIRSQFASPDIRFLKARKVPQAERIKLGEKWITHYEEDNILNSVQLQLELLDDIGFKETANPFIFWQNGLIWARK